MDTSKMTKDERICWEIYRDLYDNAEPKANFDELVANAKINERKEKEIPYNDYEIDGELFDEIFEKHMKKNKISKRQEKAFRFEIYLGCSPKTKRSNDEVIS